MKKVLKVAVAFIAFTASVEGAPWVGWDAPLGNGHFYTVTDSAMTWFDARDAATNLGGYLTSIGSLEELNFIRTSFGRTELFWTGLSTITDNLEWDNGEPLTFTYFGAQQPDTTQYSAIVINGVNSRGFTRGSFQDVNLLSDPLYRGVIERDTDPNAQNPIDNPVPDGGSTLVLLGLSVLAAGAWKVGRG